MSIAATRFSKHSLLFSCALLFVALSPFTQAEPSNFRLGVGSFVLDIEHAPAGIADGSQMGGAIVAEFPQSNYAGSRFIAYRIDTDGVKVKGGETQLMWGYGLAQPGVRIYTGPTWHYERMEVPRAGGIKTRTFKDWGWQLGTGFQFRAVTLDYAISLRDNGQYKTENARAGVSNGDVWTHTLLLSYRF